MQREFKGKENIRKLPITINCDTPLTWTRCSACKKEFKKEMLFCVTSYRDKYSEVEYICKHCAKNEKEVIDILNKKIFLYDEVIDVSSSWKKWGVIGGMIAIFLFILIMIS